MSLANKALIHRRTDKCLNQHNPSAHADFYAKDLVYHTGSLGELSAAAHCEYLQSLFAAFPDAHWSVSAQISENDLVVTQWSLIATHLGAFRGITPTGRQLLCGGICIDRIANGKIVEEWEEWDTLGMLQQLGAPAPLKTESVEPEPTVADQNAVAV